jgi:hypothetical protein
MLVSCIMVRSSQIQERAVRGEISWTGSTLVRRPRALPMTRQVRGGGPAEASGITEDIPKRRERQPHACFTSINGWRPLLDTHPASAEHLGGPEE